MDRSALLVTARTLAMEAGDNFTMAQLCRASHLTRARLRRHFPTKAALLSELQDCPAKPEQIKHSALPLNPVIIEDDWIERQFRIYDRALSNIESRLDTECTVLTRRTEALEEQLLVRQPKEQPTPEVLELPPFVHEVPAAAEVYTDNSAETAKVSDLFVSAAPIASFERDDHAIGARGRFSHVLEQARRSVHDAVETKSQKSNNMRQMSIVLGLCVMASIGVVGAFASINHSLSTARAPQTIIQKIATKPNSVTIIDASGVLPIGIGQASPKVHDLMARAQKGDLQAQVSLASAFLHGDGVEADPASAIRWSQIAAMEGDPTAEFLLGTLYANGVKPNPNLALQWYTASASHGNAKAMHNLAVAYVTGEGTEKDPSAAITWFKRAAQLGYHDSVFDLAVMYERGEGVAQDKNEALRWYDKAASDGDIEAAKRASWLRSNS